jgi:hypothetical protein
MESNNFSDIQILEHLRGAFDRQAFQIPWDHQSLMFETQLPAFDKAIEDTICAVNTGERKTRVGTIIDQGNGKSKNNIKNLEWRLKMNDVETQLKKIRILLRQGYRDRADIDGAAIDEARTEIINELNKIFEVVGILLLRSVKPGGYGLDL